MDRLTNSDLVALTTLRRELHMCPEISGEEVKTAARIADALRGLGADQVMTGLGGHGVAGVFEGVAEGPTVLLRCELDALPIEETGTVDWRSRILGKGHLCGHDGHMVTMLGVGQLLSRQRPARGRVVLMFQPAEEVGTGAIAVYEDPAFAPLAPDWAFALHNEPDVPRGEAHVPVGLASCPSVGLKITLAGREAHACAPWTGTSPGMVVAGLITALPTKRRGDFPAPDYRQITICHARLGTPSFGIAPGEAVVQATLRTTSDAGLDELVELVRAETQEAAAAHQITCQITEHDRFLAGVNDPEAAGILALAAETAGLQVSAGAPLLASEDFGRFGHDCPSAMLLLGAGPGPALHKPDYDFDDDLIAPGVSLLLGAARHVVG